MKLLVLDVETDYDNFLNNAYNPNGRCYCVGAFSDNHATVVDTSSQGMEKIQRLVDQHDTIAGHNLKFDLHWLERLGIDFTGKRFFCTMIAEYLLTSSTIKMKDNTLNKLGIHYLNEEKLDVVKEEYWKKGINTDLVPWDILSDYCLQDCKLTYEIAMIQISNIPDHMKMLVSICMQDMKLLQEMEKRGILLDVAEANRQAKAAYTQIVELQNKLMAEIPYKDINLNSNDQLSVLLYGGVIIEKRKVPNGVYGPKAQKAGETKYKIEQIEHHFPRKYKPIKGTEAVKEGYWSTDDVTLTKLKDKGGLLTIIKQLRKIKREYDTYFVGIAKKVLEFNWQDNIVHGNYNCSLTGTGRLSSSQPNMQNLSVEAQKLFITRY